MQYFQTLRRFFNPPWCVLIDSYLLLRETYWSLHYKFEFESFYLGYLLIYHLLQYLLFAFIIDILPFHIYKNWPASFYKKYFKAYFENFIDTELPIQKLQF